MVFIANDKTTKTMKPSKESFYTPTSLISSERPPILGRGSSAFSVWSNEFNASLLPESLVEAVAVVGLVANKPVRQLVDEAFVECPFDEPDFVGRSIFSAGGERKTSAVCNCHDLGPFAPLRLTNSKAPFFAPEKEPSMKPSSKSNLPLLTRS